MYKYVARNDVRAYDLSLSYCCAPRPDHRRTEGQGWERGGAQAGVRGRWEEPRAPRKEDGSLRRGYNLRREGPPTWPSALWPWVLDIPAPAPLTSGPRRPGRALRQVPCGLVWAPSATRTSRPDGLQAGVCVCVCERA